MHDQAFHILEYDKLRELIRQGAQTQMGNHRVDQLQPIDERQALDSSLEALAECVHLRERGISWSFTDLPDPSEALALLRVDGTVLEATAFLDLKTLAEQAMSARGAILAERDQAPVLWGIVGNLPAELNRLIAKIANKILPSGELDDRASPELARVRHDISKLRSRITRTLENLMRRSEEAIQDELVTIRNERFVIPVKADHRGRINGVAHGYSSSGATAFVEPLETIESNNELQALHEAEAREIIRILVGLTEELRAQLPAVEMAHAAVGELDFINAKTVFHRRFNGVIPDISESSTLNIDQARHPLLEDNLRTTGGEVVPVSLDLDQEHNAMVISGANAGGKTVVLKTAGLLSLMALSGVSLPARSATVPFYACVLADIGDHQSLAANLSTFTSHVANISRMIEICRAPALVLLDEVGTGTDPEEGSALGVAVVHHFRKRCHAQVIATTHYGGLKHYASTEEGVLNASVEFDEKTLQPTYRLMVGLAGASSGLEIARRFGIPGEIIEGALHSVKDSTRQAAQYLQRIKRESEDAENLRRALEEERAAVAEKFASLDEQAVRRERERQTTFERELRERLAAFEAKSKELLSNVHDRAERLKVEREIAKRTAELKRESQRIESTKDSRSKEGGMPPDRPVRVVRDGVQVERSTTKIEEEKIYQPVSHRPIAVGDKVKLKSFGSIGIVDAIKGDQVELRVKSLRMREKLENLELVEEAAPKATEKFASLRQSKSTEVKLRTENGSSELNVIGKTSDEAVDAVDKFLDEASIANLNEVRIIHGHGTGALRRAISEMLKDHPHVARFAAAPQEQGGSGATVVELRP